MSVPVPNRSAAPPWLRVVSGILLVSFCAVVATITFWPGPPDPDGQQALREFLIRAHNHGLPTWITFGKVEFGANILMFVPIGLFGALSLRRMRWLIIPAAIGASTVIEFIQHAGLPQRVGSTRDVVANGSGAVVGYLLSCLVIALVLRAASRREAPSAGSAAPTGGTTSAATGGTASAAQWTPSGRPPSTPPDNSALPPALHL